MIPKHNPSRSDLNPSDGRECCRMESQHLGYGRRGRRSCVAPSGVCIDQNNVLLFGRRVKEVAWHLLKLIVTRRSVQTGLVITVSPFKYGPRGIAASYLRHCGRHLGTVDDPAKHLQAIQKTRNKSPSEKLPLRFSGPRWITVIRFDLLKISSLIKP
jgi:hypothetical protein